jgi:hypothetical protein
MPFQDPVAALLKIATALPAEVERAVYEEGLGVMKESMRRTPVDTGALRATHETSKPITEGGVTRVTISVGGPAAPYAVFVHEDNQAHHTVGQAGFLRSAAYEAAAGMAERVARRIDLNRLKR